jgi:hypothetical protein
MGLKHYYGGAGAHSIAQTEAAFAAYSEEIVAPSLVF